MVDTQKRLTNVELERKKAIFSIQCYYCGSSEPQMFFKWGNSGSGGKSGLSIDRRVGSSNLPPSQSVVVSLGKTYSQQQSPVQGTMMVLEKWYIRALDLQKSLFDVLCFKVKLPAQQCDLIRSYRLFRQVFLILTAQLLVTFIAVAICTLSIKAKKFIQANPWMIYLSFIVNLAVMIALVCFRDLSRKYPWNLLALVGTIGASQQTITHASVVHL